jgi:tRNA-modifying protein YgfZ
LVLDSYRALVERAGLVDLNGRGRLCIVGADREKFLHGQVTNDVLGLKPGTGCYAALVNAKGRMLSDLFIHKLENELLLDFEPGLSEQVKDRLQKFIIAEDVQVVDVSPIYGLVAVHGPEATAVLAKVVFNDPPVAPLSWIKSGEIYLVRNDRYGLPGFDLFAPLEELARLSGLLQGAGALPVGDDAVNTLRIENGIPRFGIDMTEENLAPETGIQQRAISYAKGCYIGQEVIARIRTYGQVAKALRLIKLEGGGSLPEPRVRLLKDGKEVGYITSSTCSPRFDARIALAYVRKECNAPGTSLQTENGDNGSVISVPGE